MIPSYMLITTQLLTKHRDDYELEYKDPDKHVIQSYLEDDPFALVALDNVLDANEKSNQDDVGNDT